MKISSLKQDTYHELLTCSWLQFGSVLLVSFIGVNVLFSSLFMLFEGSFISPSHLQGYPHFVTGLFLSVQTMSTIGYGGILPTSLAGELIAALESLIGLMFTALSTGLIFARLSQPNAKILFADNLLYNQTDAGPALIFRVANERGNDIHNAQATLTCVDMATHTAHLNMVTIQDLKLRRSSMPSFYLSWTLIHDLDEESPLQRYTVEALSAPTMIYILNISGYDSSFSQTIYQYQRYRGPSLKAGLRFKDMVHINPTTGEAEVRLEALHELVDAQ